ncbi:MAG: hypothetical protein ACXV8A_04425 [Chthoniobacterales bacterium]
MNGPAKPERILLVRLAAFFLASATCCGGVPGGNLVEAISDECDTLNPIWTAGLRGMPEFRSVQDGVLSIRSIDNGDDPYPSAEDMTSTYSDEIGRGLDAAEGPSVVAQIYLPPFEQWPTGVNASGFREWFGVRVTAYDASLPMLGGLYFPGIYIATDDNGSCLIARVGDGYAPDVTIARIAVAGWWTFGLSFNTEGVTEYYAAPGRISLTSSDLLHVTPHFDDPVANRSIDQLIGNFIALRMTYPPTGQLSPDWRMDNFRVYVLTPPALPLVTAQRQNAAANIQITGCSRGFRYLVQRSNDLAMWQTVLDFISDGNAVMYSESAASRGFYRVARP